MKSVSMKNTRHNFVKQNLVTLPSARGGYDVYKCSKCGLHGKRRGLMDSLQVDGRTSQKKIKECDGVAPANPKQVRVIHCWATGEIFSNLTDDSTHNVVPAPAKDAHLTGTWVMGLDGITPVRLLEDEYEEIKDVHPA